MINNQPSAAGSDCLRAESTMRGGERRQRRISLRIVVAAYALVYPTVLAIGYFSPNAMRLGVLLTVFLVWLTSSTSCLFGIWTIYGEPRFWWRLVFVVAGVLYCYAMTVSSMLFSLFSSFGQVSQMPMSLLVVFFLFFCCYSLSVIGIAVAFLVIERFGARLVLLDTVSLEKREQPFQFTLRSLIGFGVVVAVLLATYRSSSVYDSETNFQVVSLLGSVLSETLISVAAVWATLGLGRPTSRLAAVTLVAIGLGLACQAVSAKPTHVFMAILLVLRMLGIAIPLLVVRSYGYRFVRCPESHPAAEQAA